jgi:hypothetical protein
VTNEDISGGVWAALGTAAGVVSAFVLQWANDRRKNRKDERSDALAEAFKLYDAACKERNELRDLHSAALVKVGTLQEQCGELKGRLERYEHGPDSGGG